MKSKLAIGALALALCVAPLAANALGKNEKGCLAGGAIGGIGGKVLGSGNHALLGAVAGCAVGVAVADNRKDKHNDRPNERERHAQYVQEDSRREAHPAQERDYYRRP
jgi:outer membrane lipoprotein SlyB